MEFLIEFSGDFFGFLFFFWLFNFQVRNDRKAEQKYNKVENENRLKHFQLLLDSVIEFIESQQRENEKYLTKQKLNIFEPYILKRVASKRFIHLRNINDKDIFEA